MTSLQCPTTLILARHGEAEYETAEWAPEGGSLTQRGRAQAAGLADRLARRRVAHVWTSTLARAVQTGEIAAAKLGVSVTTRLGLEELSIGDHAGASRTMDPIAQVYAAWLSGDLDQRIAGGETGHEIVVRMQKVLAEIADAHPGETVLVVSHGGVLRLAVPALTRMDIEPQRQDNCSVIEVDADADDWVCRTWA